MLMENLGKYAVDNSNNNNINNEVNYIINHTGAPGKMFIVVKYYLFGEKNDEIQTIIQQNELRQMMKDNEIEAKLKSQVYNKVFQRKESIIRKEEVVMTEE